MIAAAQALDIRGYKLGKGVAIAQKVIRKHVDHLDNDRPLFVDHDTMVEVLRSGELLSAVENEIGSLD